MKNEAYKKLTEDIKKDFAEKLISQQFVDFITRAKSADDKDYGTFKVIISTEDVDRQGESVLLSGWDLSFYKLNPVVLWAHDYSQMPIGVCTSIDIADGKLVAEGKFAPTDFAQDVRKLYDLGMLRTTSVGFIPKEWHASEGGVITRAELLEFSFVPVPANPYALSMNQMKELGFDVAALKTKGIELTIKTEEGAPVTTPPADTTTTPPAIDPATVPPATDPAQAKTDDPTANEVRLMAVIKDVYTHLTAACTALKGFAEPEGDKGVNAKDEAVDTSEQRSTTSPETLSEVEKFLKNRELVRTINIALGKVLRAYNRADRTRS